MKFNLLISLVLVLSSTAVASLAVDPKDFNREQIDKMWPEMWQSSSPHVKVPTVDPLSPEQVISQMTGNWNVRMGWDKDLLFLETNGQVSVSGIQDGKKWERHGEWKVISNKLVLFMPEDDIPMFIFRTKGELYNFNPWAKFLMSELQRPTVPAPALANSVQQPQPVLAANGKIAKAQVLDILHSVDDGSLENNAATVAAHFASNAIIVATVVEGGRTDTSTNDLDTYRRDFGVGLKEFENYKLQRRDVSVQTAPNGRKATSISTIVENYAFQGNAQEATTRELATFEVIDGKILITRMDSKVTVKDVPPN